MVANSNNSIVSFIDSQLPQFIREDNPNFSAFIKAYYEWLENETEDGPLYHTKKLLDYSDIDKTTDDFIQYFKRDFLPYFPEEIALDERKLIKRAREFYAKNGTIESIQFLFRVLYDKEVEIFYPKEQILRASDGKWNLPQSIRLSISTANESFDIKQLEKKLATGEVSKASCIVESAYRIVDRDLNKELFELYVSNVNRLFSTAENLLVVYDYDVLGNPLTFSGKIIGSISNITVDSKNQGLRYRGTERNSLGVITYPGDPVVLVGGLANTSEAQEAIAYVGNVTSGQIKSVSVVDGGYGFRLEPYTDVIVKTPSTDPGTGANIIVQTLDTANQVTRYINNDSIKYKAASLISSANYAFTNIASANLNTTMANAFSFDLLTFAPLRSMNVVSGGAGYRTVPTLDFDVLYESDFSSNVSETGSNVAIQHIKDLGMIANVKIINAGSGYSNATDKIIFSSQTGTTANAGFSTDANGSITAVWMISEGTGYYTMPYVSLANSANTQNASSGANASLIAYAYGDGETTSVAVDDIGRVQSIRIISRGFDYESTPNVSLRVQDIKVVPLSGSQFLYESDVLYQGADINSANYIAYVDSYDRPNACVRVFNYRGSINLQNKIIGPTFNLTVNTAVTQNVVTYGNGRAKANAQFLNGLIKYNGFWSKTDGMLSSDQYLQDSERYHNFSYEVLVDKALSSYRDTLKNILHPTGTQMLGLYRIPDDKPTRDITSANIIYSNLVSGNVAVEAINFRANTTRFYYSMSYGVSSTQEDAAIAPDGTFTADMLIDLPSFSSDPTTNHYIAYTVPLTQIANGYVYNMSVYLKKGTSDNAALSCLNFNTEPSKTAYFNLNNGTVIAAAAANSITRITPAGNGWYRCSLSGGIANTSTAPVFRIFTTKQKTSSTTAFIGNCNNTIYVWGMQIEKGTIPSDYVSSNDVFISRTTVSTYHAANGLLMTAAINAPINSAYRYDNTSNTWVSRGKMVVEPGRTVAFRATSNIANSNWFKSNTSVDLTQNTIAPDGTNTAVYVYKTVDSTDYGSFLQTSGGAYTPGQQMCHSIYVKKKDANIHKVQIVQHGNFLNYNGASVQTTFNVTSGVIEQVAPNTFPLMENVGNGWYRISTTTYATNTIASGVDIIMQFRIPSGQGSNNEGLYFWGAQMEGAPNSQPWGATSFFLNAGSGATTRTTPIFSSEQDRKVFAASNTLIGNANSTSFLTTAKIGDMVVLNPGSSREIVKFVANVRNNVEISLDSNVSYIGEGKISISNGSNIYTISTTTTTNLIANDVIRIWNSSFSNDALVISTSGNTITTNLAATMNASNLSYAVSPLINTASYKIITV